MKHAKENCPPNNLFVHKKYIDLPNPRLIECNLEESDIIDIQQIFMSLGLNHIKIKNEQEGRRIIAKFLDALNCFYEVGCLTTSSSQLPENIWDMYYHLAAGRYIQHNQLIKREQFFVNEFYADFLWIEVTDNLMLQPWFGMIQNAFIDLHIDQHVPIIFVSYQDQ